MYKRIIAFLLCIGLLFAALPVTVQAVPEEEEVLQAISDDYHNILRRTNLRSLSGYCGLMASWQLYFLGINNWVVSYHGCNQFDAYRDAAATSGGHRVAAYSAQDYDLEEALLMLSKNGTRNVYNILVGFQQTNTALGSVYGHSMVIYAILEGRVYFTEGYRTPFGPAGMPFSVTISEFADYYNGRGVYEGLIHFGRKGYTANCTEYASNLYLEVTAAAPVYSQPCTPKTEGAESVFIRTVNPGERLWANALFANPQGELYYQVSDSGTAGYIPAENAEPFYFIYEDIGVSNAQHPIDLAVGEKCQITGRISAEYSAVDGIWVTIANAQGTVLEHALAKRSGVYDLEDDTFSRVVRLDRLEEGSYTYNIYAQGKNFYVREGQVVSQNCQLHLVEQPFRVGDGAPAVTAEEPPEVQDGWVYDQGTWYCYRQGSPRIGWYCYHGADYYLKADGSVTTGWAVIQGKPRYFSSAGCMRTGWMETENGTVYLMFNGVPATGKRTIDGKEYTFDENGYLQNNAPGIPGALLMH